MSAQKPENRPLTAAMVNALQYTIGTPDTYKPQVNTLKALEKRGLIANHKLTLAGVEVVKDGDNNSYFIISRNNTMGDSYTDDADAITGIDNAVALAKTHLQKEECQNISATIYTTDNHCAVITLTQDDFPDSSIDDLSDNDIFDALMDTLDENFPLEIPLTTVGGKRLVDMSEREIEDYAAQNPPAVQDLDGIADLFNQQVVSQENQLPENFTPMLAHRWDEKTDPTGWYMSEKLDGVRAIWTGSQLQTRTGKILHAPDWFIQGLPAVALDGELTMGRGRFQETVGIVRRHQGDWQGVQYMIFDLIDFEKNYLEREGVLTEIWQTLPEHCDVVHVTRCQGKADLHAYLHDIEAQGGEGVMLRKPDSLYQQKRSRDLLKVKSHQSAEALVIGYTEGKGKHQGVIGALQCKADNGKTFKLGTGLSDAERQNPPAIGERVTYQYFETTNAGVPRFPVFVAVRNYE